MKHIDNEGSNKGIPFPQLKGTNALHHTLNTIILFSAREWDLFIQPLFYLFIFWAIGEFWWKESPGDEHWGWGKETGSRFQPTLVFPDQFCRYFHHEFVYN